MTQAVAHVNDVLTSRLLDLAEERFGPPPYAYAWLALGSHGRGEQVLSSDQDSALTYGGPRLGPGEADEYFARLAEPVVDGLARAGIPRCTGGYMATEWREPLPDAHRGTSSAGSTTRCPAPCSRPRSSSTSDRSTATST